MFLNPTNKLIDKPQSGPLARVLVIDDEDMVRMMITDVLETIGYEVTPCSSVKAAEQVLARRGSRSFDCVMTDYKMPGKTGLDLLRWLREADNDISIIVFTGYSSHQDVARMIREGAIDVINKPANFDLLKQVLARGVRLTREKRKWVQTEEAAAQMALMHDYLLELMGVRKAAFLDVCFIPKHRAGGDFIAYHPQPDGSFLLLFADVSGHNLDAAYISAYFQGLVSGMVRNRNSVESIISDFNTFLVERWNDRSFEEALDSAPETSICCVFIQKAAGADGLEFTNNGLPPPYRTTSEGLCLPLGEGNTPLGLYEELDTFSAHLPFADGGELIICSDGLLDFAAMRKVSAPSAAFRLLAASDDGERRNLLADAEDDVMAARLKLDPSDSTSVRLLLYESFAGDEFSKIDDLEDGWSRSLLFALPDIDQEKLYGVLLTAREAVLNAMQHGCGRDPNKRCSLTISFFPGNNFLRSRIEDPGNGHDDTFLTDEDPEITEDRHSGFILMRNFPDSVHTKRRGAVVIMDFFAILGENT